MRGNDGSFRQPAQISPQKLDPMRRIKLVFLINSLAIGGAERQLVTLATSLDPAIFDITVLCFYGGGEFGQELADAKIPLVSLEKKGRWDVQGFLRRLRSTLKRIQPDVIHSYMTVANLLGTLLKPILPSTRVVWGVESAYIDFAQCKLLDRLSLRLEQRLSHFADLIIFNSFAGRDFHLSGGFSGTRTVVIHNGIDTERFRPDRRSGSLLRATWQIPEGSLLIGIAARLDPIKDHQTFLRAASIFARTRPETRFVCIGGGPQPYFDELRDLAEQLDLTDKVVWPGFIRDMASAYNALDICCSSSYSEATSNAVAEAMACGTPCVVTDVGDSKLIVGDTGIVVPPRNPEALAAGWSQMAARLTGHPSMRQEARTRIETQFSLAALVKRTSNSLLELL